MKTSLHATIILGTLCLAACESEFEPLPSRLVLEGCFDSMGYPDIILTRSIVTDGTNTDVSELLMRWATVRISDDSGREVILTGSPSKRHFPPYHYTTTEMRGEPGRTYTITATYRDLSVTATARMPYPTLIDSVSSAPVSDNDTLRALTLHFTAPNDCPAYYHVSTMLHGCDGRFLPGTLGVVEATTPGAAMSVPAMRAKSSVDTADFVPHMPAGALCGIRLERVEPEIYEFWKVFSNQALFGSSEFFDTTFSLPGHVDGGFGIWSPQGVDIVYIEVE